MNMTVKKMLCIVFAFVLLVAVLAAWYVLPLYTGMNATGHPVSVYVDNDDTQDSVTVKVGSPRGWTLLNAVFDAQPRTGRYVVEPGESVLSVYRKMRNGLQTPVNLTIPQVRTMDMLAGYLAARLMPDSTSMASAFADTAFCARWGYTPQTLPAMFIPNTYQMWWNITLDKFMLRMQRENASFWNGERDGLAQKIGMTHEEVVTLASIVEEETSYVPEMPRVAGLYVHRMQIGMPLQADPTVKYALGDFSLRRIYNEHLKVESPYNTYINMGLPPGPIRIPSVKAIDAVLHYEHHNYLYMCAKDDFSGSHNFAVTYTEHLANARRYAKALNNRGIK